MLQAYRYSWSISRYESRGDEKKFEPLNSNEGSKLMEKIDNLTNRLLNIENYVTLTTAVSGTVIKKIDRYM